MDFLGIFRQLVDPRSSTEVGRCALALAAGYVFGEDLKSHAQRQCPNQCCYSPFDGFEHDTTGQKKHMTIKRMRKAADWDDSVLADILAQNVF